MNDFNFYTKGEEIANAITHGIGALLAIVAGVLLIVFSALTGDPYKIVSFTIFATSLIILYLNSTLYHSITNMKAKKVFRIIDHSSIYLLIAGTYTPYTLTILRHGLGWWIFGFIWGTAVVGIVFKALWLDRFDKISTVLYVIMGWAIVIAMKDLIKLLPTGGLVFLVVGGILYTGGCIFFSKDEWPYNHAIWHLFVIAGSACHFFSVLLYL